MMKQFLIFNLFVLFPYWCLSHPGIGIVKDSKGFIYYTDLKNVLKIDPQTKKETIVVRNVHTHELFMDGSDNLYGEHLWYNGDQLNTWGHYVWRLHSGGKLDTVVEPSPGFLEHYSFTRDSADNMYWAQRSVPESRIEKMTPQGVVTTLYEGTFKNIRWIHVSPGGVVYVVDLTDLYKIENGKLELLAEKLHERTSLLEYGGLQHNILGIWLDKTGNVYVAVTGGQVVKKVTPAGSVTDVVYSSGGWRPTGGVFDNDDNLWLLENSMSETRVRKIDKIELLKKPPVITNVVNKSKPFLILATIFLVAGFIIYRLAKKIKRKREMDRRSS
ncbi:MAG: hypothetical protein V4722_05335 [Bacteroidota bacterium]